MLPIFNLYIPWLKQSLMAKVWKAFINLKIEGLWYENNRSFLMTEIHYGLLSRRDFLLHAVSCTAIPFLSTLVFAQADYTSALN